MPEIQLEQHPQTGLTVGYTDSSGATILAIISQNYFNQFIQFYQSISDPGSENEYTRFLNMLKYPT